MSEKNTTIVPKKMQTALTTETNKVQEYVSSVKVDSNKKFDIVKTHTDSAKALIKQATEFFKPHVDRANEAKKALVTDRDAIIKPLKALVDEGSRKNGAYLTDLKHKEEEERKAIEKAEQKRIKDEASERAAKLKNIGKPNKAKRILREAKEEASIVVIPTYSNAPTSSYSSVTRTNWTFEIEDEDIIPREFMMPDLVKIGKYVRDKKDTGSIAGVKIKSIIKTS